MLVFNISSFAKARKLAFSSSRMLIICMLDFLCPSSVFVTISNPFIPLFVLCSSCSPHSVSLEALYIVLIPSRVRPSLVLFLKCTFIFFLFFSGFYYLLRCSNYDLCSFMSSVVLFPKSLLTYFEIVSNCVGLFSHSRLLYGMLHGL